MKWISVNDLLPVIGVEVVAFRPDALLDYNDKPLRLCCRKLDGTWSGCHKVTHWLDVGMPPGWAEEHAKRQNS